MARIQVKAYRVDIIEYKRGWGSKIDQTIYFDNEPEAREQVRKFNAQKTSETVDWYMVAQYRGKA